MFKHLLVPIAGDDLSPRAMHASVELAHKLGASITGFIAEPPAPPPPTGQRAMRYLETLEEHKRETAEHASDVMSTFEATAKEAALAEALKITATNPTLTNEDLAQRVQVNLSLSTTIRTLTEWVRAWRRQGFLPPQKR